MITYKNTSFADATIDLDNTAFENCRFTGCTLVFRAVGSVSLTGCKFDRCAFTFDGPAALTLQFLRRLNSDFGKGGTEVFEQLIASLREPAEQSEQETIGG